MGIACYNDEEASVKNGRKSENTRAIASFRLLQANCDRNNMTPGQQAKIQVFEHPLRKRYDILKQSRPLDTLVQECLDFFFKP